MGRNNQRRTQKDHLVNDYNDMSVENSELRQQIQKLKKQLGQSEDEPKKQKTPKKVENDNPKCEDCGNNTFKVNYTKMGTDWSFFKCEACKFRTVGKKD